MHDDYFDHKSHNYESMIRLTWILWLHVKLRWWIRRQTLKKHNEWCSYGWKSQLMLFIFPKFSSFYNIIIYYIWHNPGTSYSYFIHDFCHFLISYCFNFLEFIVLFICFKQGVKKKWSKIRLKLRFSKST